MLYHCVFSPSFAPHELRELLFDVIHHCVRSSVDLQAWRQGQSLDFGIDLTCCIESDLALFWCPHGSSKLACSVSLLVRPSCKIVRGISGPTTMSGWYSSNKALLWSGSTMSRQYRAFDMQGLRLTFCVTRVDNGVLIFHVCDHTTDEALRPFWGVVNCA
jgi:hypothetical protein